MNPLRPPDELRDVAVFPRKRLRNLYAARAPADDAPALACIGNAVISVRRVKSGAIEGFAAGNVRVKRPVQEAGCAYDHIAMDIFTLRRF